MSKNSVLNALASKNASKNQTPAASQAPKPETTPAENQEVTNVYALGANDEGKIYVKSAERYDSNPVFKKAVKKVHKLNLDASVTENVTKVEALLAEAGMVRKSKKGAASQATNSAPNAEGKKRTPPTPPQFKPEVFDNVPTGESGKLESWIQANPRTNPIKEFILLIAEVDEMTPKLKNGKPVKKNGEPVMIPTGKKTQEYKLCYCMDVTDAGVYLRDVHTGEQTAFLPEELKKHVVYAPKYDEDGNETNEVDKDMVVAKMFVVRPKQTQTQTA